MKSLEEKINYKFKNNRLLQNALTHSSYTNENRGKACDSNERLEFLGDSVLGLIVAETLFELFPGMPEGRMTRLRAQLVCEESLLRAANELGLGEYIRLGKGEERSGGRTRASILADAVEALIAALYLDGGFDTAKGFIMLRLIPDMAEENTLSGLDCKTKLQELIQRKSGQILSYELLGETGPDHYKVFTAQVSLNGEPIGSGSGHSKKEAEQSAARSALESIEG